MSIALIAPPCTLPMCIAPGGAAVAGGAIVAGIGSIGLSGFGRVIAGANGGAVMPGIGAIVVRGEGVGDGIDMPPIGCIWAAAGFIEMSASATVVNVNLKLSKAILGLVYYKP